MTPEHNSLLSGLIGQLVCRVWCDGIAFLAERWTSWVRFSAVVLIGLCVGGCDFRRSGSAGVHPTPDLENLPKLLIEEGAACAADALGVDEGFLVFLFPYDNHEQIAEELGVTFPRNVRRMHLNSRDGWGALCYFKNPDEGVCIEVHDSSVNFATLLPERVFPATSCFRTDPDLGNRWVRGPGVRLVDPGER